MNTQQPTSDKKAPAEAAERQPAEALYPGQKGFAPGQPVAVGGEILLGDAIEYNADRKTVKLSVRNTGDRPIQIGSHFHFFEVNRYLEFDRDAAFGCHLNIPATTAVRFEPGDMKEVELVPFSGKRRVIGFNGLVMGYTGEEDDPSYYPVHLAAVRRARHAGFKSSSEKNPQNGADKTRNDAAAAAQAAPRTPEKNDNDKKR